MIVKAIKLQNINDEWQYYIRIEKGADRVTISVGEKNYNAMQELLNKAEQPELPLGEKGEKKK